MSVIDFLLGTDGIDEFQEEQKNKNNTREKKKYHIVFPGVVTQNLPKVDLLTQKIKSMMSSLTMLIFSL